MLKNANKCSEKMRCKGKELSGEIRKKYQFTRDVFVQKTRKKIVIILAKTRDVCYNKIKIGIGLSSSEKIDIYEGSEYTFQSEVK